MAKRLKTISRELRVFKLLLAFFLAAFFVITILNFIFGLLVHFYDHQQSLLWHSLSPYVIGVSLTIIYLSVIKKSWHYRKGGRGIAKYLKARSLERINGVPEEILALELNTEIAEECGMMPAKLFVFTEEQGINALTVGYHVSNVSIILTWGALQSMDRNELKGLLAYEYQKIISEDYVENTQLDILFSGLLAISQWGSYVLVKGTDKQVVTSSLRLSAVYVALGSFIWLVGSLGVLVTRLFKCILLYRRVLTTDYNVIEWLDPQNILHALTRIYIHELGSQLFRVQSEALSHYCFANALTTQSWLTIHPLLSKRINYLHPHFGRKALSNTKNEQVNWQSIISKILLPTNEDRLWENFVAQQRLPPDQLPLLRLSPISFTSKDAVRPLSPDIRQRLERPELLARAMQTATGSREVIMAIFMIRQYREFLPEDIQVSKAIIEALMKVDGRIHVQIFYEALNNIGAMPTISGRHFVHRISQVIHADGEVGLLDTLLVDRIKATQGLLDDALPVAREHCIAAIVHIVDALLHVQQINTHYQLHTRKKILEKVLSYAEMQKFQHISEEPLDLDYSLRLLSGLLVRERLYLLTVAEYCLWSDRIITQDELDVLELLYWRLGFESHQVVSRILKQSQLLII